MKKIVKKIVKVGLPYKESKFISHSSQKCYKVELVGDKYEYLMTDIPAGGFRIISALDYDGIEKKINTQQVIRSEEVIIEQFLFDITKQEYLNRGCDAPEGVRVLDKIVVGHPYNVEFVIDKENVDVDFAYCNYFISSDVWEDKSINYKYVSLITENARKILDSEWFKVLSDNGLNPRLSLQLVENETNDEFEIKESDDIDEIISLCNDFLHSDKVNTHTIICYFYCDDFTQNGDWGRWFSFVNIAEKYGYPIEVVKLLYRSDCDFNILNYEDKYESSLIKSLNKEN